MRATLRDMPDLFSINQLDAGLRARGLALEYKPLLRAITEQLSNGNVTCDPTLGRYGQEGPAPPGFCGYQGRPARTPLHARALAAISGARLSAQLLARGHCASCGGIRLCFVMTAKAKLRDLSG
jgi:hypothetical protein